MDCDRTRDLLSDYLGGELADDEREAVSAHMDGCSRCATEAEELARTLALLRGLPRMSAPLELLDRVMAGVARGPAPAAGAPKRPFALGRVRIPLEAAAAVFLVVLVYGIQKSMPPPSEPPQVAARPPAAAEPARDVARALPRSPAPAKEARKSGPAAAASAPATRHVEKPAALPPRAEAAPTETARGNAAPAPGGARAESADAGPRAATGRMEFREAAAPRRPAPGLAAGAFYTLAPATRVSSEEETIAPRVYAAPPSRVMGPMPYGRDVTLEVAPGDRDGVEGRIVAAAERLGGGVHPGASGGMAHPPIPGAVRVNVPAEAADAFLDALAGLGTVPRGGMAVPIDLPAGPSPGVVAYTVRIRVR